ncbi:hypothetical protein [Aminipila terrae]|uniref:Uncharacterized protein n=1 Tax=Aminipila terrae TaxID=2697030 RepID=A0A6P1MFG9_9FIRM|nr:hypothetical protein [Aminipila terrae]QHI73459.1 hypothetical protein Ami3637_14700 [Aminipila terrae]
MKKYRLEKAICLLISVIIVFSGCNTGRETQKDLNSSETSESAVQNHSSGDKTSKSAIQSNTLNNNCWKNVKKYSAYIGKTIFKVSEEHGNMNYNWYGDTNQSANAMDNVIFYFPKLVWNNSTCSAVAVEGDNILSDKVQSFDSKDMETYFGIGYTHHNADESGKGYYEYDIDNLRVIIYDTPKGGIEPATMYVLIESMDETAGISEIMSKNSENAKVSEPQLRKASKWNGVRGYINKIGKSKKEVLVDGVSWKENTASNYYEDPNSNIGYTFDKSDICCYICLPMNLLMSAQNNGKLEMEDIAEHFNLPFSWFVYEDVGYQYYFEDIVVGIPSDIRGQVSESAIISISKRTK